MVTNHIHLMRHGHSALAFPNHWITPGQFRDWIEVYNRTGIAQDSVPADNVVTLMRDDPIAVCSDFPRSIESAARLDSQREPRISPVYREVGRPLQGDWKIRLPLEMWDRLSVLCWKLDLIAVDESVRAARARARAAALELVGLAEESSPVLLVGHGMINAMIARELCREGWTGPRQANDDYWGTVSFDRGA
jgi:broad specificity phosphatase PhoE